MIQRILTALLGLAVVVVALFITSLLIAVVLAVGLLSWAWLWWRGRRPVAQGGGRVIEGEYRIVDSK